MPHTYHFTITDTLIGTKYPITYNTNLLPTQLISLLTKGDLSCDCKLAHLCGIEGALCGNTRFKIDSPTLGCALSPFA